MKTIIWKELRENLKWAALALICLTFAEIYILSSQRQANNAYYGATLCGSTFLLVTAFGCSAIGAALGAVQILPELRQDQWAALLHRPVSRETIFFGKVIAGLLLYVIATGIPLLVSVAYAAAPGQFPSPLTPGMILPAASDVFLGMAFYFGALLIALSRGPWYGSRGVLAFALLPVFVFHLETKWMFLLPLGASLVLALAACGAIMSNGLVKDRPKAGRWSFVLVMFAGVAAIVLIADWGLSLMPAMTGENSFAFSYTTLVLSKEGRLLMEVRHGYTSSPTLMDMDGKPAPDGSDAGNSNDWQYAYQFTQLCWDFDRSRSIFDAYLAQNPRYLSNYIQIANGDNNGYKEDWYCLVGANYFVGYDKLSRRRVGICDREGFHPPGTTPAPFPVRLESSEANSQPFLDWAGGALYGIDFSERSMARIVNEQGGAIYGAVGIGGKGGRRDKMLYVGVALRKELQVLDLRGKLLFATPYSHDPSIWSTISIETTLAGDRIFIKYDPRYFPSKSVAENSANPTFVDEMDLQGKVLHSYSKLIDNMYVKPPGWQDRVVACTLPFAPVAFCAIESRLVTPKDTDSYYSSYQPPSFDIPLSSLAILFGVSAALAICAFLWARHVGFANARAARWAAFVFCLGVPGFITFRLAVDWPIRVRCPKCSAKRQIESEECPACHQPWPSPELTGAEIFNPITT